MNHLRTFEEASSQCGQDSNQSERSTEELSLYSDHNQVVTARNLTPQLSEQAEKQAAE